MNPHDRLVLRALVRAPATADALMASDEPPMGKTNVVWGTVEPEVPEDPRADR